MESDLDPLYLHTGLLIGCGLSGNSPYYLTDHSRLPGILITCIGHVLHIQYIYFVIHSWTTGIRGS